MLAALLLLPARGGAAPGDCGQPVSTGASPTASDALFVLRVAIGLNACELAVCDVDGTCSITATDALRLLAHATGATIELGCGDGCGLPTTSTLPATTTTIMPTPTWTQVLAVLAANTCTTINCHGSAGLPSGELGGLDDFDAGYDQLVGTPVACFGSAFAVRVEPGDAAASFLLDKLGASPECGSRMPLGVEIGAFPPVAPADVELIRRWIESGAPKN